MPQAVVSVSDHRQGIPSEHKVRYGANTKYATARHVNRRHNPQHGDALRGRFTRRPASQRGGGLSQGGWEEQSRSIQRGERNRLRVSP